MKPWMKTALPIAVAAAIWFMPAPEGMPPAALPFLSVFLGVMIALVLEPLPASAVGLIGVTLATALQLVPQPGGAAATTASSLRWALSGFADSTVWLIFGAFMFAMGYEKTGLGKRLALWLIKKLGRSALGLGYAAALADLVLAPFIPANTARSGGTIYAVVKNIPPMYQSFPESDRRKIGAYLMWTCFAATCVTSSMFFTALAPNFLALSVVQKTVPGVSISWMEWFIAVAPASIPLFFSVPLLAYIVYPPTQKHFPEAPEWAAGELEKLGPLTRREITMALVAFGALVLWIAGGKIMNATTVGLVAICLMLIFDVVNWEDISGNKSAWNTFVWFATLIPLAGGLGLVGFLKWLGGVASAHLAGHDMFVIIFGILTIFFFTHYFFASLTAHTTAMLPIMLATGLAVTGMDMRYLAMLLCGSLGFMGVITPFGTGAAPIYANCGYLPPKDFWRLGGIFGLVNFIVYAIVGMTWMPMVL